MTRLVTFSNPWAKLMNGQGVTIRRAKLLQILVVELSDLSKELLNYDTAFGAIKLPEQGPALMLLFQKPGATDLFTSLRPFTPDQLAMYSQHIGEVWEVVIHIKQAA